MTFFYGVEEAKRYAKSRPYFHPFAVKWAAKALGIDDKLPIALDIACGTGMSTLALAAIAEKIVGLDISWNMLSNADSNQRIQYTNARSELLPFKSNSVSFVSCALAFHWFDRDAFLREAARVLKAECFLFLYNNGFTGTMRGQADFYDWAHNTYPARFPTPPRNHQPLTDGDLTRAGFVLIGEDRYQNDVSFTPDQLVGYLGTQTNVVAALQQGRETVESAYRWLLGQVAPYFIDEKAVFVFSTRAMYLVRSSV
ncbi:MAG TPA: methyltransferase domain-containing protein [Anaerolineales bacterium]|nr:methyltransferase domain-containing protein [Anaerolineales bacterium]